MATSTDLTPDHTYIDPHLPYIDPHTTSFVNVTQYLVPQLARTVTITLIAFITSKEQANIALALKLRKEGIITTPRVLFKALIK